MSEAVCGRIRGCDGSALGSSRVELSRTDSCLTQVGELDDESEGGSDIRSGRSHGCARGRLRGNTLSDAPRPDAPPPDAPRQAVGVVKQGVAPSGVTYTVTAIDPESRGQKPGEAFCFEIATTNAAARMCAPAPDEDGLINGQPPRPAFALLGPDRFFAAIAPPGRPDDEDQA